MGAPVAWFEIHSDDPEGVDDLDAYVENAATLGGTTLMAPMQLPGNYGQVAMVADRDGRPVGLWR